MQKRILLAVFILTVVATGNAQIKKGTLLMGGQLSFYSQNAGNNITGAWYADNKGFSVSPAVGMAIKENYIVGVDGNFSHSNNKSAASPEQTSNMYGLGLFARKYKLLGKGFYLFGQGRVGGSYYRQSFTDLQQPLNNSLVKGFSVQLAFYPGLSYTLNKKLQVELGFNNLAAIRFDHSQQTYSSGSSKFTNNNFYLSSSLSSFAGPTIGFQVLLN